jgi:hypothetical protein
MINQGEVQQDVVIREDKGRTLLCGAKEFILDENSIKDESSF